MTVKLPGKQKPNIIRPKSIVSVSKRGKVQTASTIRHPSVVERIAAIHREARHDLSSISRKLNANLQKKR